MDKIERVKELKRAGDNHGAAELLLEMIDDTEREARESGPGFGVAPWPYEQLAIVRGKLKDVDGEVEVLERFARREHAPGVKPANLLDRLVKAYQKADRLEERKDTSGQPQLYLKGSDTSLDHMEIFLLRGVAVDTETTGLSRQDEVIDFAAVPFRFSRRSGEVVDVQEPYSALREPGCPIAPQASRVHGLFLPDVRGHRLDEGRVREVLTSADAVFAHNASFDRRFVSGLNQSFYWLRWYCTQNGVSWQELGCATAKLEHVLERNAIIRDRAHRAIDDAQAVVELLKCSHPDGNPYLLHVFQGRPLRWRTERSRTMSVAVGIEPRRQQPQASKPTGSGCASVVAFVVAGLTALAATVGLALA